MAGPLIISVSNRKGGSGKSTTVVNLAAEWARRGARVLVIDMDTQGHAGLGLGITVPKGTPTVHHLFKDGGGDLCSAVIGTDWPNLSCVPADDLFDGVDFSPGLDVLSSQLRSADFQRNYDFIILDTPPSLDFILMNAMAAADGVLVPLLPHTLSAEGVKQLARLFFPHRGHSQSET